METLRQVRIDEARLAEVPTTVAKRKDVESKPTKNETSSHLLHMLRTTPEMAQQH